MAGTTYPVTHNQIGVNTKSTSAGFTDEIDFADDLNAVEVFTNGAADAYVTVDGSAPAAGANNSWHIPAGAPNGRIIPVKSQGPTVVKVFCAAVIVYGVCRT